MLSLESEQLLAEQQLGKVRMPSESPGGGKSIPRLAGGQLCQVLAPAPTRMVLGHPTPPELRTPGVVTFTGGGVKREGGTVP